MGLTKYFWLHLFSYCNFFYHVCLQHFFLYMLFGTESKNFCMNYQHITLLLQTLFFKVILSIAV